MSKKVLLKPYADENLIVQFCEPLELTKDVNITVPRQFKAYLYIDEKIEAVVKQCADERVFDLLNKDRSYLKKQLQVAFVSTVFPKILWGVGDIQVKNSKLKQAYRVGANGECIFEVVNDRRFIDNFKFGTVITLDDIKKKVLSCMQMVASDAVATLFADTTVSVFEVTAKTEEVSMAIKKQLNEKELIKDMGIEVNTLTAKIFVPEEDMLMIKNAVNSEGDSDEV